VDIVRHTVPDSVYQLHVQQPSTYEKPRGCQCSFRLLMMGGVSPETCRSSYKYGIIKFWYIVAFCWTFLYELYYDAQIQEYQEFVVSLLPTCSFLVLSSDVRVWPYYSYAVVHFADLFITGSSVIREESLIHCGVCIISTHFLLHYWSAWKHLCFYIAVSPYIALVLFVHSSHTSLLK